MLRKPIENKLKANTAIGQAALIGDKEKFISVLISPNFDVLEKWAKSNGVDTGDRAKMVADPKVKAMYKEAVDKINGSLAHFESIKKIGVVPDEWTPESGEMTPSLKLKRRVIVEKYKDQIAGFYKAD